MQTNRCFYHQSVFSVLRPVEAFVLNMDWFFLIQFLRNNAAFTYNESFFPLSMSKTPERAASTSSAGSTNR